MSKQIDENASRVVDYILQNCDAESVTFYTWSDLINEVHGDTLSFPTRSSSAASQSLSRHFKKIRKAIIQHGWDVIKLSFEPFRTFHLQSGVIVKPDRYDIETCSRFLPSSHNRAVALAIIGPYCDSHPLLVPDRMRTTRCAISWRTAALGKLSSDVQRKRLSIQMADEMATSLGSRLTLQLEDATIQED